jgi:dolichol-phosphate mannosyltransferase
MRSTVYRGHNIGVLSVPPADVTVVMPTYNEHDGSSRSSTRFCRRCPPPGAELVIVDDNCRTAQQTGRLVTRHRMLSSIARANPLGTAVMEAFAPRRPTSCVMDGDFSHPPAMVPSSRLVATGADVVVGSRHIPGGSTPDWPARRRAMSRRMLARP